MAFEDLFDELLATRRRYEDLKLEGGNFGERARLREHLRELRAQIASSQGVA